MAIGDVKSDILSVTNGVNVDIRPPFGEEWVIHNIYYHQAVEFIYTNGAIEAKFDGDSGNGARLGGVYHVTNSLWMRVKALNTGAIAYDGIQTK